MKYPKEYLEEIKTRLKVSQVVSKSVKLKKRGKLGREWAIKNNLTVEAMSRLFMEQINESLEK